MPPPLINPDDVNDARIDGDTDATPPLERSDATLIPPSRGVALAADDGYEIGRSNASNSRMDRLLSDDGRAQAKNS